MTVEDKDIYESSDNIFQRACAGATTYARDLANTRGSVATPAFMEEAIRKLVKGHKNVKELRVVDSD